MPPVPGWVSEIFILDAFGSGVLYANFNTTFEPENPIYDFALFDLNSFLISPPYGINPAYVDGNTRFLRLKPVGATVQGNLPGYIEYDFVVVTSNAGMYHIGMMLNASDFITMKRPLNRTVLYQVYNSYGPDILNTYDVHNYNNKLVVRMSRKNDSAEYLTVYELNRTSFLGPYTKANLVQLKASYLNSAA